MKPKTVKIYEEKTWCPSLKLKKQKTQYKRVFLLCNKKKCTNEITIIGKKYSTYNILLHKNVSNMQLILHMLSRYLASDIHSVVDTKKVC